MRVVMATEPGTPGRPNEDFAAAAPGAAVLLDGATLPAGADCGCVHGVAWFARSLGTALLAGITATPPADLRDALADAVAAVRDQHAGTCDLSRPLTPGATVAAVRAGPAGVSYLAVSDSSILADYGPGRPPVLITDDHRGIRADPRAARAARAGVLAPDGLRGIALLSDGATRLADRFGLAGWPAVLDTIRADGPGALIRQVRAAEASDPHGTRWPRGKHHDDATVLWWPADP
jgi:Protein phosphatase 2C